MPAVKATRDESGRREMRAAPWPVRRGGAGALARRHWPLRRRFNGPTTNQGRPLRASPAHPIAVAPPLARGPALGSGRASTAPAGH